jgi:hypothetical protein
MDLLDKTLDEIESVSFKKPQEGHSALVNKVYLLRKKKLKDYTAEDLRLMIAQHQGWDHLVPLAIDYLESDPFIEGDFYEGDLLISVLKCDRDFWNKHSTYKIRMSKVIQLAVDRVPEIDLLDDIKSEILDRIKVYQSYISA